MEIHQDTGSKHAVELRLARFRQLMHEIQEGVGPSSVLPQNDLISNAERVLSVVRGLRQREPTEVDLSQLRTFGRPLYFQLSKLVEFIDTEMQSRTSSDLPIALVRAITHSATEMSFMASTFGFVAEREASRFLLLGDPADLAYQQVLLWTEGYLK